MTSLCAGIAILGLCLPVPGHSVRSVDEAGWVKQSEAEGTWSAAHVFASNAYRLGALVEGDQRGVTGVWLRESRASDREAPDSPLRRALSRVRGGAKEGTPCRFHGYSFVRTACGDGWLLYAVALKPKRQELEERCNRYGRWE